MRVSQQSRRRRRFQSNQICCVIDALERRRMFDGETVSAPIAPVLASPSNPSSNQITLNQHFFDATLPGTLVTFQTTEGEIQVGLTDAATPLTVANFLSYVNSNAYVDTFFHRSVDISTGLGGSPTAPGTIVQGGGYSIMNGSIGHITTNAPVQDEYTSELYGDVAGTIAMAKTSDANSATSEFYFNVTDNTELDTPTTDANGVTTSYTVFGKVLSGSSVISTIAALPTYDISDGLDTVPVTGLTEAQVSAGASLTASNLVFITSATSEPGTSYTVTSSNKALVTPSVSDGVLSLAYGTGASGTATITVKATNLDGTTATTEFSVTVPNAATPTAGPVATDVTAPFTVTGTTGAFNVLGSDTDSLAALDPSTIQIVTQPAHGTASLDPSTGLIDYTPAAGYLGPDSLTYTVADTQGTVSNVATVTLDAVPTAVSVTIGGPKASSLTFTQPDGITGHLSLKGCTALVTFTDYRVTTSTHNGAVSATGLGTTITSIVLTNVPHEFASLIVTSNGPVELGSVNDLGPVNGILAKNATMTGTCGFGAINVITVAALLDVTLGTGSGFGTVINVPVVTDTSVSGNVIQSINSRQWINDNGGNYNISSTNISGLFVSGEFDENLALTGKGYGIFYGKLGTVTGSWGLSGSIFKVLMSATPGPNWSLKSDGLVKTLAVHGNLANNITAAAIGTLTATGTSTGTVIQTDAGFSKNFQQIGHIGFGGAVTGTVIFAAGNIGSFSAPSIANSRIYAGVNLTVAQNGDLAKSASDIADDARIGSVTLGRGANAFSSSLISADILGSMNLGKVNTSNGGTAEGISAHTIGSVSATLVPGGVLHAGPAQLKTAAALTKFETLKKITLGDFAIDIF